MKQRIHIALASAIALLPQIAAAHPGHFHFDPTVAPHAGHGGEIALLLFGAFSVVGLLIHRRLAARR